MSNWDIGITESTANNHIYVTLRLGKITESSKEPREGFFPAMTKNNSGVENHFFAKTYDNLTGYIKGLRWYQNTLDNGTVLKGWKLTIDVGQDRDFVLDIGSKQRPFNKFMSCLGNVDFTRPVRIVGFTGKEGDKVLLMSQDKNEEGKPIWIEQKFPMRFLSQALIDKLKAKEALTEQDEYNIARDANGKILGQMKYDEIDGTFSEGYPYVFQNRDGEWQFTVYTAFLIDFTNRVTLPRLEDELKEQPTITRQVTQPADDFPEHSGAPAEDDLRFKTASASHDNDPDSDIPF